MARYGWGSRNDWRMANGAPLAGRDLTSKLDELARSAGGLVRLAAGSTGGAAAPAPTATPAGSTGGVAAPASNAAAGGGIAPNQFAESWGGHGRPQTAPLTRSDFLALLKKGDPNALRFVAAGAPAISASFANKVANGDRATLDFVAANQAQADAAQAPAGVPAAAYAQAMRDGSPDVLRFIASLRGLAG